MCIKLICWIFHYLLIDMATRHFSSDEVFDFFVESSSEQSDGSDSEYLPSDSDSCTEEPQAKRWRMEAKTDVEGGASEIEVELSEDDVPSTNLGDSGWTAPDLKAPNIPPFTAKAGININTQNFQVADFFHAFVTHNILEEMVIHTNHFAEQSIAAIPHAPHSRALKWYPTNVEELKKFLGLTLAMGIVKKPTIQSYWDMHSVLCLPLFSAIMPRNRYELLLRFLNFNTIEMTMPPNHDHLHKLRPLIDSLNAQFSEVYTPSQNLTINESHLLYKGRVMTGYMPDEPPSHGIKFYKLYESASGYTRAFKIDGGKDKSIHHSKCPPDLTRTGKIVWDLLEPILYKGYHLYMDNIYTSVSLFNALRHCGTVACGIVSRNHQGLPQQLLTTKLNRGESIALRKGDLLALKYADKVSIILLSTIHDESTTKVRSTGQGAPALKPVCFRDYNKYMGGADKSDQILAFYQATRKSIAWYKKVAIHLMQIAVLNAYVVYKTADPGGPLSYLKFQTELITQLVTIGYDVEPVLADDTVLRLTGRHFMSKIPSTPTRSHPQKRCRVCSSHGIRKDSRFYCPDCPSKPGLCIDQCYKKYHTMLNC
ncbi:piggyBac transposable element-derived protein 4-like [Leptodactylus fuscus]